MIPGRKWTIIISSLLIAICSLFIACHNPWITEIWELKTARFETNGGNSISSQKLLKGEKVKRPADPIKNNHLFTAWYIEEELETEYDFDTIPTGDLTLYAGWRFYGLLLFPIEEDDDLDFGSADFGYTGIFPQTVSVINKTDYKINDISVEVTGDGAIYFNVAPGLSFALEPEEEKEFTVYVLDGAPSGEHTATVTFSGTGVDGTYTTSFGLKFTVNPVATPLEITLDIDPIAEKAEISPLPSGWSYINAGSYYDSGISLSIAATDSETISVTLPAGVTNIRWEVAGVGAYAGEFVSGTGNSFTIMASLTDADHVKYCTTGFHFVRLYVTADGKEYMVSIRFVITV